jgi:hypothetical protein
MLMVICFLCVVCCYVCERRLVLGCPPLAYDISYYGIVLGVGISIVVLDAYAILVKYLAQEYGGREKNDKPVVLCVLCVVKNSYLLQQFYQRQI